MRNSVLVPIAIVVAGILIAGAVYLGQNKNESTVNEDGLQTVSIQVEPISEKDHTLGDPETAVASFIEYSDPSCPFCATFHDTMDKIYEKYQDKISWTYRYFWPPLSVQQGSQIYHPLSEGAIKASKCVAELKGNEAFWEYTADLFNTKILESESLKNQAIALGVDQSAFSDCVSSNKYDQFIEDSFNKSISAGAQGTPYTVVLLKEGVNGELEEFVKDFQQQSPGVMFVSDDKKIITLSGALPIAILEQLLDIIL